ncbi:type II secretion system F family protein [Dehalobacter sp. TBBPA1]|uniref:type II secretion system F family protein n=1 Tax=Dehalobacter sp. TBBPA1 TaxID=3235037 RepID=UPI0034A1D593
MNVILLIACIGMITGFFIILSLSPMEFTDSVFKNILNKPRSIKEEINEITKRKKVSYFRREVIEVQSILKLTGREGWFPMICAVSLLLFAIGSGIAIVLGNFFSVPVLGIGFMLLPFWYVRLTQTHFKRDIAAELETALSIITTAYLRNEDIVTAVEENIDYLNPPVLSVFKGFVYRIKMINPDIAAGLEDMKVQLENAVFREWCDALIACQIDRNLKTTLTPIVSKLSDMRVVNGELENMVFEPRKEFISMQLLVVGNIPLLYFLNKDWYNALMHTPLGQIILAICFAAIFISAAFVIKLTQPIEYRR